jgi:hypothetical protein
VQLLEHLLVGLKFLGSGWLLRELREAQLGDVSMVHQGIRFKMRVSEGGL